jgi:ankyrin repeat protein
MITYLIGAGADMSVRNAYGRTPLSLCLDTQTTRQLYDMQRAITNNLATPSTEDATKQTSSQT